MTAELERPPCPSWCQVDHSDEPDHRCHTGVVAEAPVVPEDDHPRTADRVRVELQAYDGPDDAGGVERLGPELWLTIVGPDPDRPAGVATHEQVRITLDGLLRLVDGIRDHLASPVLARLALADQLHHQDGPKGDPLGDVTGWGDDDGREEPPTSCRPSAGPPRATPATLVEWDRQQTAEGYSPRTKDVRRKTVRLIAEQGHVTPAQVTREHVLDYLSSHPLAPNTRIKYLQHLKAWAQFAQIPDPTSGIRRPPAPPSRPKPITDDDLAKLLNAATGRRRLFVMLGAYAGLRSFETAKVERGDLEDAGDGTYRLRVLGKGGRTEVLPCNPALARAVIDYAQANDITTGRLFPAADGKTVQNALRRLGDTAGVDFSSHQLRHWYGTAAHRASGGDLLITQRLMRHSNPSTTAGYAAVSGDGLRSVIDGLAGYAGAPVPPTPPEEGARAGLRVLRGGLQVTHQ